MDDHGSGGFGYPCELRRGKRQRLVIHGSYQRRRAGWRGRVPFLRWQWVRDKETTLNAFVVPRGDGWTPVHVTLSDKGGPAWKRDYRVYLNLIETPDDLPANALVGMPI